MLLFHSLVYSDPLYDALYSDYSCTDDCRVLRFSNVSRTLSPGLQAGNYILGIALILAFLSSTLLNPLVFYHFWNEKTIMDVMFRILALCDFLTNIFSPIYFAAQMFNPHVEPSVSRSIGHMIAQGISCNLGCLSQSATTLLAVARYLRLRSPYFRINIPLFIFLFTAYAVAMTAVTIVGKYALLYVEVGPPYISIRAILKDVCFYLNIIQCFIGLTFSFLCVGTLFSMRPPKGQPIAEKTHKMKIKGCFTILLINLPYLIALIIGVTGIITTKRHIQEFNFSILPILTSGINPVILTWRNTAIKKRLYVLQSKLKLGAAKDKYKLHYNHETAVSLVQATEPYTKQDSV